MTDDDFILCVVKDRLKGHIPADEETVLEEGNTRANQSSEHTETTTQNNEGDPPTRDNASSTSGAFRVIALSSGFSSTRLIKDDFTNLDESAREADTSMGAEEGRLSLRPSTLPTSMEGNGADSYLVEATLVEGNANLEGQSPEDGADLVTAKPVASTRTINRRIAAAVLVVALVILGVLLGVLIPSNAEAEPTPLPVDENEVIAFAPHSICYSHIPRLTDLSRVCVDPASLPQGGPLCQLAAVAVLDQTLEALASLDQTPAADVSLINAGGQRGDILSGNVTVGDAISIMPFQSNRIFLVSLSGSLLLDTLEDAINKSISVIPLKVSITAAYPYSAGLRFDVSLTAAYGSRVTEVEINSGLSSPSGWTPIDPLGNYRVATNSYLAGGGDNFFTGVPKEDMTEVAVGVTDAFIDYCRKVGVLNSPGLDEMSTQGFSGL